MSDITPKLVHVELTSENIKYITAFIRRASREGYITVLKVGPSISESMLISLFNHLETAKTYNNESILEFVEFEKA